MKLFSIYHYLILVLFLLSIFILDLLFPSKHELISLIITTITLVFLGIYTYDTRRLANHSEKVAIRPLVLRTGILNWKINSMQMISNKNGFNLVFINVKNIALDVKGNIVVDKKKYQLLFGNEISVSDINIISYQENNAKLAAVGIFERWGWLPENGSVWATFDETKFEIVSGNNEIVISYLDIEGNEFTFKESADFKQTNRENRP